jgi:PAS domain-containing protein
LEDREKALVLLAGKDSAGRDFYDVAARALIAALGCRWAGVARLRGDGRTAETLAFWEGERRLEPCAYDLSATPCYEAYRSDVDNSHSFHPDRVSELFPDDPLLRGRAVSCYRGEAFFDLNGAPAGHVFALSENAETDAPADRDFLSFVTRRVGAEFNRRRTEQALQDSEERMLQAIESISEGFALFDGRDRLVLCSSKFRKLLSTIADILKPGTRMEDMVRALAERGFYADAEGRVDDWVRDRMEQHRAPGIPFEQALSDGRHVQIIEYRTADGGTALIRSDITERKRAEEALKISEVYLSRSQRIAGLAYWVWDEVNGKMSEYSDQLPKILGGSPDKTLASLEGCLELIHPDDRQRYESVVLDAERHAKDYDIEY